MSDMQHFKELCEAATRGPYHVDQRDLVAPDEEAVAEVFYNIDANAALLTLSRNYVERLVEEMEDAAMEAHVGNDEHGLRFVDCADLDCVRRKALLREIEEAAKGER